MAFFDLIFNSRVGLHPEVEPSDYVTTHTGILTCTDEETGESKPVGKLSAMKVHVSLASEHGVSLFDVCDCHSHELHHIHTLLFKPRGYSLKSSLEHRFEPNQMDLLVLDYVVLKPKWRGLKLGLLAVRKTIDQLGGGCGLVVSEIESLNDEASRLLKISKSWVPQNTTTEAAKTARTKLRSYFRQMGFERLGRTEYYALSTSHPMPGSHEILRPGSHQE